MRTSLASPARVIKWGSTLTVFLYCAISALRQHQHGLAYSADAMLPLVVLFLCSTSVIFYLFHPLADRVEDHGGYLVVRKGKLEQRIDLDEIGSVDFTVRSPPLVKLHLLRSDKFNGSVSFIPVDDCWSIMLENRSALVADLNTRIGRLRA